MAYLIYPFIVQFGGFLRAGKMHDIYLHYKLHKPMSTKSKFI